MSMSSCDAGSSSPGVPPDIKPPVNCSTSVPQGKTTINQEPQVARKAFVVTDAVREKVRYLAGLGGRQDDIAKFIGCAPKTLRTRFRDELDRGVAEANATISGSLFGAAKGGNVTAQIFWVEDEGALARRAGGGRPGPERRCRVQFGGDPHLARQQP
jgi:hypothetical protein